MLETAKAIKMTDELVAAEEPATPAKKRKKKVEPVKVEPVKVEPPKTGILLRYDQMISFGEIGQKQLVYVLNWDSDYVKTGKVYWKSYSEILSANAGEYYLPSKEGAHQWSFNQWNCAYGGNTFQYSDCGQYFEPVDQEWAAKAVLRKCSIDKVVPKHILNILRKAPENPQARAMLLAVTKKAMPDTLKTYEEIESWVVDKLGPPPAKLDLMPVRPAKRANAFVVEFKKHSKAYGVCDYEQGMTGKVIAQVTSDDLEEIIARSSDTLSMEALAKYVQSELEYKFSHLDATDVRPANDTRTYSRYRQQGVDSQKLELRGGVNALLAKLTDYMKANMPDDPRIRKQTNE